MAEATTETAAPSALSSATGSATGTLVEQVEAGADAPLKDGPTPDKKGVETTAGEGGEEAAKAKAEGDKKPEAKAGAPEKYEDFKLPEGVSVDAELLEGATKLFKESNLSQEAAQRFVDFHAQALTKAGEAPYRLWEQTQEKWLNEVKADKELGSGNDKTPLRPEVSARIAKVLDEFGGAKLREAFDFTGAGNHPEIIRAFDKMAKVLTEGPHRAGRGPVAVPKSAAEAMYPHLPSGG